jgi:hypothetical protein
MSSESLCQVARSWVEVDSFHTRSIVRFMIFTASGWNVLGTTLYPQASHMNTEFNLVDKPSVPLSQMSVPITTL